MKVYNIKFVTEIINMMSEEELENISQENIDDMVDQERLMSFTICAHDFEEASEIAHGFIQNMIGEDSEYTLEGVSPVLDDSGEHLFISNWGMNLDEPDCPYCAIEHGEVAPDDVLKFNCDACGKEIVVADNGWEEILCNGEMCDNVLYRKNLSEINGVWVYQKKDLGNLESE